MRVKAKTQKTLLTEAAKRPSPVKPAQCRVCLTDETWDSEFRPSLRKGICKDRAACEERQPPLIPLEEL